MFAAFILPLVVAYGCHVTCGLEVSDDTTCGGLLSGSGGTITSPGYPYGYPSNHLCIWLIEASPGQRVRLYLETVDLEQATSTSCWDYIEIRDGSHGRPLFGLECHRYSPGTVESTARWIWIRFKSDNNYGGTGFRARWTPIQGEEEDTETEPYSACTGDGDWQCGNYECIRVSEQCNNVNDCGDMSDELACDSHNKSGKKTVLIAVTVSIIVFVLLASIFAFFTYCHILRHRNTGSDVSNPEAKLNASYKTATVFYTAAGDGNVLFRDFTDIGTDIDQMNPRFNEDVARQPPGLTLPLFRSGRHVSALPPIAD
ncbi:membrane frizzled-related protein-like [Saccoglossus kowalevskii]